MKLSDAIEVLKDYDRVIKIAYPKPFADKLTEAIGTVISHINTGNKTALDDSLREKLIEQPDNQEGLSNKKDMENFAEWMIGRSADWITDEERCETAETFIEMWEKERGEK